MANMRSLVTQANLLCDWGIWTGRLPLDARDRFVREYVTDPVTTAGQVLLAEPKLSYHRACPLFFDYDEERAERAGQQWRQRREEERRANAAVSEAIVGTLRQLGHDPTDPELRDLVQTEIRKADQASRAAAKQAATAARRAARKAFKAEAERPLGQLAARWR